MEGIPVTNIYYGISWFSALLSITLLVVGLWNTSLSSSEKGFYGMSFTLALFAAITYRKTHVTVRALSLRQPKARNR